MKPSRYHTSLDVHNPSQGFVGRVEVAIKATVLIATVSCERHYTMDTPLDMVSKDIAAGLRALADKVESGQ